MKLLNTWIKTLLNDSSLSGPMGYNRKERVLMMYLLKTNAIDYTDQSKDRLKKDRKINKVSLRYNRIDSRYKSVYDYLADLMYQNHEPNEPMIITCSGKKFEFYTKCGDFYNISHCLAGGVFFYHIKKRKFLENKESDGCMVMEDELKPDLVKCHKDPSTKLKKKIAEKCLSFFEKYGTQNPELAKRIETGSKKRYHFLDGLQTFKKGKRKYSVKDIKKLLV